jgi:hypothetical protein
MVMSSPRLASAPQLDVDARKGRYGVAYLDAIVTDAGFDLTEPKPGADMLAYDATVNFPEGGVRVQIKTTHTYAIDGTNSRLAYTATEKWVQSWATALCPVYFVVVVVPNSENGGPWLDHLPTGTEMRRTAAFWSRIDASQFTSSNMSVAADRSQRVTGATLETWQQEFVQGYGG